MPPIGRKYEWRDSCFVVGMTYTKTVSASLFMALASVACAAPAQEDDPQAGAAAVTIGSDGTWAPTAAKLAKGSLEVLRGLSLTNVDSSIGGTSDTSCVASAAPSGPKALTIAAGKYTPKDARTVERDRGMSVTIEFEDFTVSCRQKLGGDESVSVQIEAALSPANTGGKVSFKAASL
jgi:hypothetical protein